MSDRCHDLIESAVPRGIFFLPLVGVAFVNWFSVLVVTEGIILGWHAKMQWVDFTSIVFFFVTFR